MMKRKIKAVFADIDGTIFSHCSGGMPQSAAQAIAYARSQGIYVFAATGRHPLELQDLNFNLKLDGFITNNGALCYNDEGVYYEDPVDPYDIRILVEALQEHPFPCQFMEKDRMYISMDSDEVRASLASIHSPMPEIVDPRRALHEKTYMVIPWAEEEIWHKIFEKMRNIKYTRWNELAADAMSKTCGKYRGVMETCRYYGIDPSMTAAIGDGPNDIELFEACGFSIAMGNSADTVKQAADAVCGDIDHDGLAKAFEQYIFHSEEEG